MAALARNAPIAAVGGRPICSTGIANGLPATLFLLYVENVLQEGARAGILLFVYFLCGILAVPVWLRLSYRFGKHRVWGRRDGLGLRRLRLGAAARPRRLLGGSWRSAC